MKYEKEFRKAHPETIGEKDSAFDMSNYSEWLDRTYMKKCFFTLLTSITPCTVKYEVFLKILKS